MERMAPASGWHSTVHGGWTHNIPAVLMIRRGIKALDLDTSRSNKVSIGRLLATLDAPVGNGPSVTTCIDCGIRCH